MYLPIAFRPRCCCTKWANTRTTRTKCLHTALCEPSTNPQVELIAILGGIADGATQVGAKDTRASYAQRALDGCRLQLHHEDVRRDRRRDDVHTLGTMVFTEFSAERDK